MRQFMEWQRVTHNLVTEQQQSLLSGCLQPAHRVAVLWEGRLWEGSELTSANCRAVSRNDPTEARSLQASGVAGMEREHACWLCCFQVKAGMAGNFPGSPMVKIPPLQLRGHGFNFWPWNSMLCYAVLSRLVVSSSLRLYGL